MKSDEVTQKLKALFSIVQNELITSSEAGNELKQKAIIIRITTIILSALITIVLGLTFLHDYGKWIAIILSGILTAINSWDAYSSYDKRVQQEIFSTNLLKHLFQDIHLCLIGNDSPEHSDYEEFKKRYNEIQEQYIRDRKNSEDDETKSITNGADIN